MDLDFDWEQVLLVKYAKPKKITGNDQRAKIKRWIILGDERKI